MHTSAAIHSPFLFMFYFYVITTTMEQDLRDRTWSPPASRLLLVSKPAFVSKKFMRNNQRAGRYIRTIKEWFHELLLTRVPTT